MNTHQSIYQILRNRALKHPAKAAYDFLDYQSTYREFLSDIDHTAAYLKELGIKRGDIVSLFLPNIPRALILFYAINKIGAISNFVHPEIPVRDYREILTKLNPVAAFVLDSMPDLIKQISELGITQRIVLVRASEFMPLHLKLLMLPQNIYHQLNIRTSDQVHYYQESKRFVDDPSANEDFQSTATILLTSGTTGAPKAVCLSSININTAAMQTAAYRKDPQEDDRMLAILPLFHAYGLVNCIHSGFYEGLTVILLPYYKERLFRSTIIKKKPNYVLGVPKLYAKLAILLTDESLDLSYFKGLYCGGSKLSSNLNRRLNNILEAHGSPTLLREGYGLTECVGACTLMPEGEVRLGSVGLPYQGVKIGIMAEDSSQFLGANETGRICIKSDTVMIGYYQSENSNIRLIDNERYLVTEDLGFLDDDGYVYFVGRLNRVVKISGYRVHPGKIEALINNLEHVQNSCVVPYFVNDIAYLKAYVVLTDSALEQQIRQQIQISCNKNLPKWCIPREIEYLDAIPQTLMSKNDYHALAE